jgi:PAS domain S-box-containing protein
MKNLKNFSTYLKTDCLREMTLEYLKILRSSNIPLVKLIIERRAYPNLSEEEAIKMTMTGLEKFLTSIEKETFYEDAKEGIRLWKENKMPIKGISRDEINPSDLVLVFAAQKKALLKFLPAFCKDSSQALNIAEELDNYYIQVESEAVKMLFDLQKQIEIRLKETEEKFTQLVHGVKDYAIYLLDTEGNVKSWNEGVERIKGYTSKDIIGKHFSVFYTTEDIKKGLPAYNLSMANKLGHFESEGLRVRKDGTRFWANVTITALYDENGRVKGFSKVTRDITEIKKAKEELENKAIELARSNTELEQFAYVASHDLQEPLRTVSSYLQLLSGRYKDKLDAEADEFIHYAVDGSNRMRQLISSLLEYSRINRVKPFEKVSLFGVISEILSDLSDQIKSTAAVIKYENLPDIYADEVLIGQLLQNLIANALKFRGDKRPEIIISAEKRNGFYLFSVKDNGIGIQKEYWEKIFIIFQRLNHRETYPGTGIGLSICKKIVERHGGKMWVESEPGKGSTFYFTIKRAEDKPEVHKVKPKANAKYNEHIAD